MLFEQEEARVIDKDTPKFQAKIYCESHKKEKAIYDKAYRKAHKKEKAILDKIYRESHKEKAVIYARQYQKTNKKALAAQKKEYRKTHKKEIAARRKANRDKTNAYALIWQKKRRGIDNKYKLNGNLSNNIGRSLRGNKNSCHWEDLVGYTLKKLMRHLEKQFIEGMSWGNYGINGWVIDHKIPIKAFNFTQPEHKDFKRCWALKNLQPMWAEDNNFKRAKLIKHFQPSLLI